ncbi:hypothetical protein [Dyadobacter sandarakinus]|uniref:Uncharacterized protein n=1 Tax=Dyadobacter sandarakinus TaxID=2747268 RepID=A0ABX7I2J5_9BACT|nr:hypothetical protein [Dyadobacter sandarakinus]QRQ99766.1 hypothetical protein HWI92_01940 [Dyadobacter sandarakinus]
MTETPNFQLLSEMGYTSINESLPEIEGRYRIRTNLGDISTSAYKDGTWAFDLMKTEKAWLTGQAVEDFVTHWKMPQAAGLQALIVAHEEPLTE